MTYEETLTHIYALGRFGIKPGLERITRLLELLGNPQKAYRVVHVVGTNGKGSTASFLSSILSAGGYRTGLFTSPHLISFTERIRIDGVELSRQETAELAQRVMAVAPEGTTFFEIITAMAALHFAERSVEVAVFEAGMGGRFDATNALQGILSVITPLSLDHCEYLGDSVEAVAAEKAGVCKAGAPIVSAPQLPQALQTIERHARELGSPLYLAGRDFQAQWQGGAVHYRGVQVELHGLVPGLPGRYQGGNAACALAAAELLSRAGFPLGQEALAAGVRQARWPGRMELFPGTPRTILDGAHNPAGVQALAEALGEVEREKLFLVVGVMGDKDLEGIVAPLLSLAEEIFTVAPALERALPPERLAEFCREKGARALSAASVADGLAQARAAAGERDLVVVTGSLFVVGEARGVLLAREFEPFRG